MDLDDLVGRAPPPETATTTTSSTTTTTATAAPPPSPVPRQRLSSVSGNDESPSKRPRAHSVGSKRCEFQVSNKEQAKKLGKRFKHLEGEKYRCENESIGTSAYWRGRRVCKDCHDLGRAMHKRRQLSKLKW